MKRYRTRRCAPLLAALALYTNCSTPTESVKPRPMAWVGATIYVDPESAPIRDGVLVTDGEVIRAVGTRSEIEIPQDARTVDASGLTICAGLWNSHVHLFREEWEDAAVLSPETLDEQLHDSFTRFGFTSVFDTGSMWSNTRTIRDQIAARKLVGPRIRSTGEALLAPGAMPAKPILRQAGFMWFRCPEITCDADAIAAVQRLVVEGADGIKIHLQPPPGSQPRFPTSAIRATVGAAHGADKLVFVHPETGEDVLAAIRSGVDILAHTTPETGPWDDALTTAGVEADVALTPTLTLWKQRDGDAEGLLCKTACDQLRAWVAAGGTVLFGTDLGAVPPDPTDEYRLMATAGMTFPEILASLTTTPAELFGDREYRGRIAPGFAADLVVLHADPAEDIAHLGRVHSTVRGGRVIHSDASQ